MSVGQTLACVGLGFRRQAGSIRVRSKGLRSPGPFVVVVPRCGWTSNPASPHTHPGSSWVRIPNGLQNSTHSAFFTACSDWAFPTSSGPPPSPTAPPFVLLPHHPLPFYFLLVRTLLPCKYLSCIAVSLLSRPSPRQSSKYPVCAESWHNYLREPVNEYPFDRVSIDRWILAATTITPKLNIGVYVACITRNYLLSLKS